MKEKLNCPNVLCNEKARKLLFARKRIAKREENTTFVPSSGRRCNLEVNRMFSLPRTDSSSVMAKVEPEAVKFIILKRGDRWSNRSPGAEDVAHRPRNDNIERTNREF